jgi:hypothetical protein
MNFRSRRQTADVHALASLATIFIDRTMLSAPRCSLIEAFLWLDGLVAGQLQRVSRRDRRQLLDFQIIQMNFRRTSQSE